MLSWAATITGKDRAVNMPRWRRANLGLRVVVARGFARIHRQNLLNFGILPLEFTDPAEYEQLERGDVLVLNDLHGNIR